MSLAISTLMDQVASEAAASGYFERVNQHEPKNAPGNGLTAAVWVDRIAPVQSSGLSSTSGVVVVFVRIYANMLSEPQDSIDPNIVTATDALLAAYSGDFDLGGNVRCVDLFGMSGFALSAQAGYIPQDGKLFRAMTITVPLIVNDIWAQVA